VTCRHSSTTVTVTTDPLCSSYDLKSPKKLADKLAEIDALRALIAGKNPPAAPDAGEFEIERVTTVAHHLVVQVRYPSCSACAYEGLKTLVFEKCALDDAIKWREIDPHFRDNSKGNKLPKKIAPSPIARFHGNDRGWALAIAFACFIDENP
jgi:hypothetical protein